MKLSVSKIFDAGQVIQAFVNAKIEGAEDFVNNIADLSDQISRAMQGKISLKDNIDCDTRTVTLSHNILSLFTPDPKKKIEHIIVSKQSDFTNPLQSFVWQYNAQGKVELKASYTTASVVKNKVTVPTSNDLTLIMYY